MKQGIQKSAVFIGKSMLWSLLLYVALMLVINWDEVTSTVSGKNKITVVNNIQPESQSGACSPDKAPANISMQVSMHNIIAILRAVSGVARPSAPF